MKRIIDTLKWLWLARAIHVPLRTVFWHEHPEGYDNPCLCDDCKECCG